MQKGRQARWGQRLDLRVPRAGGRSGRLGGSRPVPAPALRGEGQPRAAAAHAAVAPGEAASLSR